MSNPYLPKAYKIIKKVKETKIDYTFKLEFDNNKVKDGQFFQVSLPGIGECPIGMSDVGNGWMDLTIRDVGIVTKKICNLKIGDTLYLRGPYGNNWPFDTVFKNKHLIIAAGGTGVSPARSLINKIYNDVNLVAKMEIFLGFKDPYNILYKNEIKSWKKKFHTFVTVDNTCDIWTGECVGLITNHLHKAELDDVKNTQVVVVGPPLMMKFTVKKFLEYKIPKQNIWISNERRMSCGIGKCGHCKINDVYICVDGPIFKYADTEFMID